MKIIKLSMAVVAIALLFSNCEYNFIVPVEVPPVVPGDTISFSEEIIPIFNDGNYCTSCHAGNIAPDLTPDNAYNSLNNATYINRETPEESLIYTYPNPDTETHKQKEYNAAQAARILQWIEQGALNN